MKIIFFYLENKALAKKWQKVKVFSAKKIRYKFQLCKKPAKIAGLRDFDIGGATQI